MASTNTFNKASWVAMKGLVLLTSELAIGALCDPQYSGEYAQKFAIGKTLTIPLSQRYIPQSNNMAYNAQALDRPYTTLTMDQTLTTPFQWEDVEKALDMERGEDRVEKIYVRPAVNYHRQGVENYFATFCYQNANMVVGALGTNPTTFDGTSAAALQNLAEMDCPTDDGELGLVLPPPVIRAVRVSNQTDFNPAADVSKQIRTGMIGTSDSFDWYRSNSLITHTAGTWAGSVTFTSGSGSSVVVGCTTGDTFNPGDKFSIADVNQVNQMTRQTTGTSAAGTKTFTVLQPVTGAASAATLTVYPPIYGPGSQYQNVDALPAAGAALTLWPGTTAPSGKSGKVGLAMHPGAFFIAGVPLEEPESVEICRQYTDPKTGLSLRFIRQWVQWPGAAPLMTNRLDNLFGAGVGLAEQEATVIACA